MELLEGTSDKAISATNVAHFLDSGNLQAAKKINKAAKVSDIGGQGVSFNKMSAEDQKKWIETSSSRHAQNIRTARDAYVPKIPTQQQQLSQANQLQKVHGADLKATAPPPASAPASPPATVRKEEQIWAGSDEDLSVRPSHSDFLTPREMRGVNPEEPASYMPGVPAGLKDAAKEVVEGTKSVASNVAKSKPAQSLLEKAGSLARGLGGDTSGRASAEAGEAFSSSAQRIFGSDETAEMFGQAGKGDILKQAWSQSGDDFSATLRTGGFSDDAIESLGKFKGEIDRVSADGGNLTAEGMQSMLKNEADLGNMYGGFSRAGATASSNSLLRMIGGESGSGFGNAMGIAAVAGLAGGANVMMGGDFVEGAAVGGGAAFGTRAIAKGIAGSMGSIEQSMMKSILGDDMVTAHTRVEAKAGTKLGDMSRKQMENITMGEISPAFTNNKNQNVLDYLTDPKMPSEQVWGKNTARDARQGVELHSDITRTVTGAQARRQNLEAIQGLADDSEQLKGFGKKKMRDMLSSEKKKNVAMNNRMLTLGGGMLAGVAFTGQSDKRNYRRGFNAHRGNRI